MRRRDKLRNIFGNKTLHAAPEDAPTQTLPTTTLVVSNTAGTPNTESGNSSRATTSDPPGTNSPLQIAIESYLNNFPEAEKRLFLLGSQEITEANLLAKVKSYDQAHKAKSRFRPRANSISRFLGALNNVIAGIAIGVQANPDVSSIVVGAVRVVIDLAIGFVDFFTKLSDMLSRFSDFLGPLAKYGESSSGSKLVQESLVNVYIDLLTFCQRARAVFVDEKGTPRKWTSWRVFWRLQWIPFEEEFGRIAADMQHHLSVLDHSVQAEGLTVSLEASRNERERKAREEVREREDFLNWISSSPFEETHRDIYAKKHAGTGEWLLENAKFRDWFDSKQSHLLWCYGKAGIGKSVLASNVIEHTTSERALDDTVGIAFAYYNYRTPELFEIDSVVAALVKQLCRKKGHIPAGFLKTKQDAMPPSLLGDKESFITAAAQFEETFLVVDALDECPKSSRHEVLNFLREIIDDDRILVKVFVTSRREPDIECEFRRLKSPNIMIEARNVTTDILNYVCSEVQRLREGEGGKKLYLQSDEMEHKIIDTLTKKADGMFLWVNLQLLNICEVSESKKDREVKKALQTLPPDLDATYIRSLQQIEKQSEYMRRLGTKALRWVLYAQRTLTTNEFQHAIATEEALVSGEQEELSDIETILGSCRHLLMEDGPTGTIRPIHYSVQEFLTQSPGSVTSLRLLDDLHDLDAISEILSETCVSYLQSKLLDQAPCSREFELYERIQENPFSWYAACAFDHHLALCRSPSKSVIKSVTKFLEQTSPFLASALQIRAVPCYTGSPHEPNPWTEFDSYAWTVDKSTVVFSTKLYDVPSLEDTWKNLERPIYALHRACAASSTNAAAHLLAEGVDVNEKDEKGVTPIYYGSVSGDIGIISMLLAKGADINAQGGYYGNALQAAAVGGHEALVGLLLDKGADINAQGGEYGNALQAAAWVGHEAVVGLLLDRGADINAQGGRYGNALQAAAAGGHEAVVGLLLDKGADINAQGGIFGNALPVASRWGGQSIVQLLRERGAVDLEDEDEEEEEEEEEEEKDEK